MAAARCQPGTESGLLPGSLWRPPGNPGGRHLKPGVRPALRRNEDLGTWYRFWVLGFGIWLGYSVSILISSLPLVVI